MTEPVGYPPPPSDDLLRESALLVARGVRRLAILGACSGTDAPTTRHRLLTLTVPGAIPFALREGDGASYGYASHTWVIDLYKWASRRPALQRDRILGLLLGYSPDAIRSFEELAGGVP